MLGILFGYLACCFSGLWVGSLVFSYEILVGSGLLVFLSLLQSWGSIHHVVSSFLFVDKFSQMLLSLSSLIIFLSVLASMSGLLKNTMSNHKGYLVSLTLVGCFLYPCFTVKSFFGFFLFFEASVIPLLMLMVRWGAQKERVQAGFYFVFFTLVGSYPFLMFMFFIYMGKGSTSMFLKGNSFYYSLPSFFELGLFSGGIFSMNFFWWLGILGLLMKLPMYGFHLWLPKAHVEAPVAGSMLLAALLLKLGGYGLIRVVSFVDKNLEYYVVPFCFIGSTITSFICMTQTDLKALMAYSSVGHMSLVAGGILLKKIWGVSGAFALMVAHGLVSSALFALANLFYERSGTRALKVTRGLNQLSLLMSFWWLLACLFNLGVPPFPNFLGEIMLVLSSLSMSFIYFLMLGVGLVFSAIYSLFMFQKVVGSVTPDYFMSLEGFNEREEFLVLFHLFPLMLLLGNISLLLV